MFIFTIFFCLYFAVQGQDIENNESKYMNLLPEKEKVEFLEKVYRRLLSEIKPVEAPKEESILITDEELNKTADYVKQVMKEESIKFENTRQNNLKAIDNAVTLSIDDVQKYETTPINPTNIKTLQEVQTKSRKNGNFSESSSDQSSLSSESEEQSTEAATMDPEYLNFQEPKNESVIVLRSDTHIDLTKKIRRNSDESDKNEESHAENPKSSTSEQVFVKSFYNMLSDESGVSLTTQITETTLTLNNFTSSDGYKITDSLMVDPTVTNSSVLVEGHYKENNVDVVKATNTEEPKTVLFVPTTEERVKNKSSILIDSAEDMLIPKINNNDTLTHQNESLIIGITATANQSNNTKTRSSLDSGSFATITKNNDPYKINEKTTTEKEAKTFKDDSSYLKILQTKYVETLPPDLGNVEVQIPKPVENNGNKLPPSEQDVRRYDVFEVEPDKSATLLLPSDNTNKDNELTHFAPANDEALHYALVHDDAPEIGHNNLGTNDGDQKHTVLEAEPGRSLFPLKSPGGNISNEEAPHYAPVHNDVQNRLGPNDEDGEGAENFADRRGNDRMKENSLRYGSVRDIDEDYYNLSSENHNYNVKRKFGFKVKTPQDNHKLKKVSVGVTDHPKKSRTLSPDDYFDMDYFYGRSKTNYEKSDPPNKNIGTENNLKSLLKSNRINARNHLILKILKDLKEEEKVSRNGQSFAADYYWSRMASESTEIKPRLPVFRNSKEKEKDVKDMLRNNLDDARELLKEVKGIHNTIVDYEDLPTKDEYFSNKRKVKTLASKESLGPKKKPHSQGQEHDKIREKSLENHDNNVDNHKKSKDAKDVDVENPKKCKKKENNEQLKESQKSEENKKSSEKHNDSKLGSLEKSEVNFEYEANINIDAKRNKFLRTLHIDFVIEPYVTALENLIKNNSDGLRKYDWLGTTVDLEAALDKLINLADSDSDEDIHPNDKAVLKYIQLVFDSAQEVQLSDLKLQAYNPYLYLRRNARRGILPRSRRKSKARNAIKMLTDFHRMLREISKDNGYRDQKYVDLDDIKVGKDSEVDKKEELLHFFVDLRSSLFQFHNALKHISSVTKYKTQKWYENLKELYLGRPKRKQLLEVLLHLFSIRLFGLIEASAKNGLEEDYNLYVVEHKKEVRRTKDELVFVIKLVNELKRIDGVD